MKVEHLKVNYPHWLANHFGAKNHAVAPGDWLSNGNWFNDTKVNVLIKSDFYLILPVEGTSNHLWSVIGVASGSIMSHMGGLFIIGSSGRMS